MIFEVGNSSEFEAISNTSICIITLSAKSDEYADGMAASCTRHGSRHDVSIYFSFLS